MLRLVQRIFLVVTVVGVAATTWAFSLIGPFDTQYQVAGIGYNALGPDRGGPMNLGQEYRWNVTTVTYGFDQSFWNYFGAPGTSAVMQAMAILNNLPAFSQMSTNLTEFPLTSQRVNYQASALNLLDLKSTALAMVLQEMGLASPERYTWTLRARIVVNNITNYTVIQRNFDPVTLAPSMYVNGTLYSYQIVDPLTGGGGATWADALENTVLDPLGQRDTAVVDMIDQNYGEGVLIPGAYFTGLTRDDVGGLRYLYYGGWFGNRYANLNTETLIPGTTATAPYWWPVGTPLPPVANQALRPGVDHINFQLYPSTYGFYDSWNVVTQQYVDTFGTNGTLQTQNTARGLADAVGNGQPDIIFTAGDLGLYSDGSPILYALAPLGAPQWVNNSALNGATTAGPGQIQTQPGAPVVIAFDNIGPWYQNTWPNLLEGPNGSGLIYASFDGTTNPPIIYPLGTTTVQEREQQIMNGY